MGWSFLKPVSAKTSGDSKLKKKRQKVRGKRFFLLLASDFLLLAFDCCLRVAGPSSFTFFQFYILPFAICNLHLPQCLPCLSHSKNGACNTYHISGFAHRYCGSARLLHIFNEHYF